MTTLVFVHGAGARRPDGGVAAAGIAEGLRKRRPDVVVTPCPWGVRHGVAVPPEWYRALAPAPGGALPGPEERVLPPVEAGLWAMLYVMPLAEVRTLAAMAASAPQRGGWPMREYVRRQLDALAAPEGRPAALAAELGLGSVFAAACAFVRDAAEVGELAGRTGLPEAEEMLRALARAVVGAAVSLADRHAGEPVPLFGAVRERLVAAVADSLLGAAAQWHGGAAGAAAAVPPWGAAATSAMDSAVGAFGHYWYYWAALAGVYPGDTLTYFGNGEAIRRDIAACVAEAEAPVVLLGHSLGSLACVDLLVSGELPGVELLVTVGSPLPMAYEFDVLPVFRRGAPLPEWFPRWLNVHDPADTWGYPASGVFGAGRVRDLEVHSGEPAGRAHVSYWMQPAFHDALADAIPAPQPAAGGR